MRAVARTDESEGFEAQLRGTSELCKVLLRVIGLASAPAARRSDVSTIVATVIDVVVHQLQLDEVDCNRDDCASADSAHDRHGAGRRIRLGAVSAVGSSEEMLHRIGCLRSPGSTHIEASRHCNNELTPFLHTQPAPTLPVGSAGLAGRRTVTWTPRRPFVTRVEILERSEKQGNPRVPYHPLSYALPVTE